MLQRYSLIPVVLLVVALAGCWEKSEVSESISDLKAKTGDMTSVSDTSPLPTEEMLASLGALNDLDTRWLLPDPVYVIAGQPRRILASALAKDNAEIIAGSLSEYLQLRLDFKKIDRFIQSVNTPGEVIVEAQERGQKIPRRMLLNRRVVVLVYAEPIKPEEFLTELFAAPGKAAEAAKQIAEIPKRKIGDREYYDLTLPDLGVPQKEALAFIDDRTVVFVDGDESMLQDALDGKPAAGAAIERIRRTDFTNLDLAFVAGREGVPFSSAAIQGMLMQYNVPEAFANLLAVYFRSMTFTVNLQADEGKPMVNAKLDTTTEKGASDIAETILGLIVTGQTTLASLDESAKKSLPIPFDFATKLLQSLSVETKEKQVDTTFAKFQGFEEVAAKGISNYQTAIKEQTKLQQRAQQLAILAQANIAYHQKNGQFPENICAADGTPLLSWRVAVLPQIGQTELYQKFKLDEPWDGPTNKPLLAEMPTIFGFAPPNAAGKTTDDEKNKTRIRRFGSEGTPFANKKLKATDLQFPGTTLLMTVVLPQHAVEWTQPDSLAFDVATIGETVGNLLFGVTFDGQTVVIPILPSSNENSAFQREYLTAFIKGGKLPQPPQQSAAPAPTSTQPTAPAPTGAVPPSPTPPKLD